MTAAPEVRAWFYTLAPDARTEFLTMDRAEMERAVKGGGRVTPLAPIPRLTSGDGAPPTESILRPLADREKSADDLMDQAREKRRHAAALITDAEALEQLAYDTAEYCGGGEP